MILHIGGDFIVDNRNIVAIFDLDNTTTSVSTQDFLKRVEKDGMVITISDELPKSFIITMQEEMTVVYLSPISSVTLQKRYMKSVGSEKL